MSTEVPGSFGSVPLVSRSTKRGDVGVRVVAVAQSTLVRGVTRLRGQRRVVCNATGANAPSSVLVQKLRLVHFCKVRVGSSDYWRGGSLAKRKYTELAGQRIPDHGLSQAAGSVGSGSDEAVVEVARSRERLEQQPFEESDATLHLGLAEVQLFGVARHCHDLAVKQSERVQREVGSCATRFFRGVAPFGRRLCLWSLSLPVIKTEP